MTEKRRKRAEDGLSRAEQEETISELEKKVSELEESLRFAKRKADDYKFELENLRRKHRVATEELEAVEKAFLEGLEHYAYPRGDCGIVGPKEMGIFDTQGDWYPFFYKGDDDHLKSQSADDFLTFWEARVREPDFDASALVDDENGNMKYAINEHHEELNQVRKSYGDAVYEAVCNAHLEVVEWGTGSVLWHHIENRKATARDVLEHCDLEIQPSYN